MLPRIKIQGPLEQKTAEQVNAVIALCGGPNDLETYVLDRAMCAVRVSLTYSHRAHEQDAWIAVGLERELRAWRGRMS